MAVSTLGRKLEQRDPSITVEVAQKEQQDALAQIFEYLSALVAARRKSPKDDLIDAIIGAEVDGEGLDEHEILSMCYQIMIAGNETTAILMSNGVVQLAEHPDARAELLRRSTTHGRRGRRDGALRFAYGAVATAHHHT
jgi:cytochrome P450